MVHVINLKELTNQERGSFFYYRKKVGAIEHLEIKMENNQQKKKSRVRPKKHQCVVLGCYSRTGDYRFHRLDTEGGRALLSRVIEQRWELRTTAPSARICSRHSEKPGSYLTSKSSEIATVSLADRNDSTVEALNRTPRRPLVRSPFTPSPRQQTKKRASPDGSVKSASSSTEQVELPMKILLQEAEIDYLKGKIAEKDAMIDKLKTTLAESPIRFDNYDYGLNLTADYSLPKDCRHWCGIEKLEELWTTVEPILNLRLTRLQKKTLRIAEEKGYASLKGHFFALLAWLRRGLRFSQLSGVASSKTSIKTHFFWIMNALQDWVDGEVYLPSVEEWIASNNRMESSQVERSTVREAYPNHLFLFVDGTIIECYKPADADGKSRHFNQKHSVHCRAFTILVTPEGKIRWLSRVYDGGINDVNAWHYSEDPCICPNGPRDEFAFKKHTPTCRRSTTPEVLKALQNRYTNRSIFTVNGQGFIPSLGGDKAYPCIRLPTIGGAAGGRYWELHCTRTATAEMDEEEARQDPFRKNDPAICPHRAVVERSFGSMKKWLLLSHKDFISKQSISELNVLVGFVAALTNYSNFKDQGFSSI